MSIPKVSTVVSGVIDVRELERLRTGYQLLSQAIDAPDAELLAPTFLREAEVFFPEIEEKAKFVEIVKSFQTQPLQTLQERHTQLFELNKKITLYATYYRFEDSRERGGVLAKLKMLYEMFGVSLDQSELTDYLPTMLEFLAYGDWDNDHGRLEDMNLLFSVLEDGTYEILQHAKDLTNEPYIDLVRVIRSVLRYAVIREQK
jgi:nitrate reductase delta subunit